MTDPSARLGPDALIDAYFDDVLTAEQVESFQAWLLASPDHAVMFARRAQEHQHLQQIFSGDRVFYLAERIGAAHEDETFSIGQLALLEDSNEDTPLVDVTERLKQQRQSKPRPRRQSEQAADAEHQRRVIVIPVPVVWLAVAAVVGFAFWVGMQGWGGKTDSPTVVEVTPPVVETPGPIAQPAPPARLIATHQARWSSAEGAIDIDSDGAMQAGEYRLEAGYAQLAMADGATVILQGPATLAIRTGGRLALSTGVLSAYVPEGAEGFVVDTPAGRVLDLGTEFAVEVVDAESVEVHVMTGRVVASLPNEGATRMLNAGDAGRMGLAADTIEPVTVDAERFALDWDQVQRSVRVEGAVQYLYDTPKSVEPATLESDERLFLIPEKRGVRIPADLVQCDFAQPGRHDRLSGTGEAIPFGTTVDSYLLHFDRVGNPDTDDLLYVEGTIHFDRPIVGVIAGNDRLYASDQLFADAKTTYPTKPAVIGRGFEGFNHSGFVQDVIEISADRRTLTARLGASLNIDHIRVLVQADEASAAHGNLKISAEAGVVLGSFSFNSTEGSK